MTVQTHTSPNRDDIQPGAMLITHHDGDQIECRVDRMEGGNVYMTILNNREIEGKTELIVPVNDVLTGTRWTLRQKAA